MDQKIAFYTQYDMTMNLYMARLAVHVGRSLVGR